MASAYDLKRAFQRILQPLAENLITRGVTANQLTGALGARLTGRLQPGTRNTIHTTLWTLFSAWFWTRR